MFALSQTSASRRPLLSTSLLDTHLAVTGWLPEVSSPRTRRQARQLRTQALRPKPIEMNTCTKTREGWEAFRDLVFAAPAFLILMESYSCATTMNNSHGIILFQKNPGGGGAPEALLELPSSGGLRECQHDLLARKNGVLSTASFDFDNPCFVGIAAGGAMIGHMLREYVQHHAS